MLAPPPKLLRRRLSIRSSAEIEELRSSFEGIQAILTLPRKQRTTQHIQQLLQFTKPFKIFSDLNAEAHLQCCHSLSYSFTENGKFVFREGDSGTSFYIILKGRCAVLVSSTRPDGKSEMRQVSSLQAGECFGELALISNQPRMASIVCREDCHFAILSRDDYTRILAKAHDRLITTKTELLTRHPIFKKLSRGALTRLTYFFKIQKFKRKQIVFTANSPATELYLVKEGEFQLTKAIAMHRLRSPSPRLMKPVHCSIDVTLLGTGELLGCEDILANRPYTYTCTCYSTNGEVMSISRKDFYQLLGNEETLSYFSSLTAAKEVYRSARIATATQIEREKRQSPITPERSRPIDLAAPQKRVSTAKSSLFLTPPKPQSLSMVVTPRHSRTPSSSVSQPLFDQSELISPTKPGHKGKSWSQVFCLKYAVAEKPRTAKGKTASVVNFHTFSLRKLRLKRFQGFLQGGGGSTRVVTNLSESLLRVKLTEVSNIEKIQA